MPRMVRIHCGDQLMVFTAAGAAAGTRKPTHSCSAETTIVPRSLPSLAWISGMRMSSAGCGVGQVPSPDGAGAGGVDCAPIAYANSTETSAGRAAWKAFVSAVLMFVLSCLGRAHDDGASFLWMNPADVVDGGGAFSRGSGDVAGTRRLPLGNLVAEVQPLHLGVLPGEGLAVGAERPWPVRLRGAVVPRNDVHVLGLQRLSRLRADQCGRDDREVAGGEWRDFDRPVLS